VIEVELTLDTSEAAVVVSLEDEAGVTTAAAWSWYLFEIDLIRTNTAVDDPPVFVSPAADPDQTTAYVVTRDHAGDPVAGATCQFRLLKPPAGDGNSYSLSAFTATSDADGLLQTPLLRGAKYQGRRGAGDWVLFHTGDDDNTYALPILLGEPDT
jgi:hypothetical protein